MIKLILRAAFLASFITPAVARGPAEGAEDEKLEEGMQNSNIVMIFADDFGYGGLSCYGATKIKTPHIENHRVIGLDPKDPISQLDNKHL